MPCENITEYQAYLGILLYSTYLYNQTVDEDKFIDPALLVNPEEIPELRKHMDGLNWSDAAAIAGQCLLYLSNYASIKETENRLNVFKHCKGCK